MSAATTPDGKQIRAIRIVGFAVGFVTMVIASGYASDVRDARFYSLVAGLFFGLMLGEQ